ncbi:hypothetical protein GCM10010399_15860 [Dactylosporangium fulvum]
MAAFSPPEHPVGKLPAAFRAAGLLAFFVFGLPDGQRGLDLRHSGSTPMIDNAP